MRTFTAAEAKNKFGEMVDHARSAPVAITKYDRPVLVVMAFEEFERLHALDSAAGRSSADTGNAGEEK
ncbi:MAG: type II toxin-antitoxin system Phd/YefM family antitoxin [Brucella sp.]